MHYITIFSGLVTIIVGFIAIYQLLRSIHQKKPNAIWVSFGVITVMLIAITVILARTIPPPPPPTPTVTPTLSIIPSPTSTPTPTPSLRPSPTPITPPPSTTPPTITSVSRITPAQNQTIFINGSKFGTQEPWAGADSNYLRIQDITHGWEAGWNWCFNGCGDWVTISVSSWTDGQIVIIGFGKSYGGDWTLYPGDQLVVSVWNPQTYAGPTKFITSVAS